MVKKSKTEAASGAASAESGGQAAKKPRARVSGGAKTKKARAGNRSVGRLALDLPVVRARKLAGDLYEAAGLAIWSEAIERAAESERAELTQLQDAICEAADLFKAAKLANPRHLTLYMVACFDREGIPDTPPRFITAPDEAAAVAIWKLAYKGQYGRRKPRAVKIPARRDASGVAE
jgi:hypothetical protein